MQDLCLPDQNKSDGPSDIAHVQRLVVRIEKKDVVARHELPLNAKRPRADGRGRFVAFGRHSVLKSQTIGLAKSRGLRALSHVP